MDLEFTFQKGKTYGKFSFRGIYYAKEIQL